MFQKAVVSERAMLARVNRWLARDGERLKKWRPRDGWKTGWFYRLNLYHNLVLDDQVGLDDIARELGVLGSGETIESSDG